MDLNLPTPGPEVIPYGILYSGTRPVYNSNAADASRTRKGWYQHPTRVQVWRVCHFTTAAKLGGAPGNRTPRERTGKNRPAPSAPRFIDRSKSVSAGLDRSLYAATYRPPFSSFRSFPRFTICPTSVITILRALERAWIDDCTSSATSTDLMPGRALTAFRIASVGFVSTTGRTVCAGSAVTMIGVISPYRPRPARLNTCFCRALRASAPTSEAMFVIYPRSASLFSISSGCSGPPASRITTSAASEIVRPATSGCGVLPLLDGCINGDKALMAARTRASSALVAASCSTSARSRSTNEAWACLMASASALIVDLSSWRNSDTSLYIITADGWRIKCLPDFASSNCLNDHHQAAASSCAAYIYASALT